MRHSEKQNVVVHCVDSCDWRYRLIDKKEGTIVVASVYIYLVCWLGVEVSVSQFIFFGVYGVQTKLLM